MLFIIIIIIKNKYAFFGACFMEREIDYKNHLKVSYIFIKLVDG